MLRSLLKVVPLLLAVAACAPDYVDEVRPVTAMAQGGGGDSSLDLNLPQGSVIPTTRKPVDVVTPPPVPDVGAQLQPTVPALADPTPTRVPPRPPMWQSPPPNYNASRPDAAPLGLPNRPPAAWRY